MTSTSTSPPPALPAEPPQPLPGGPPRAADPGAASRRNSAPPVLTSLAVAVALVAVIFTWRRLFLGTDLNDEGFSIAMPYRLALGSRPFVDEMSVLQTAQFFLYPFVKAYVWLRGGDEGIVLFTRHVYLVWTVGVSLVACLSLRRLLRWEHALAASLICTTFVFVSTTNLSYNTLGAGLLVIGMALGARTIVGDDGVGWLLAAGVAQGLAAFAYPTLLLALPVSGACLVLAMRERRRSAAGFWLCGVAGTLAAEALVLASFGPRNVVRSARLQFAVWGKINDLSGPAKLWALGDGVLGHLGLYPLIVAAALVVWVAYRRWPLARLALALAPLALLPFGEQLVSGGDGFGVIYGLAAPFFYLFVPEARRELATRLLVWGYVPALAAGVISGYSSTNGWVQMDVGLLPAMVLSGVFLALALTPREGEGDRVRLLLPGLALACLAGLLAVTVVYQYQFLPRAVPYSHLTAIVRGGPYAGVRTTPQRAAYLSELRRDLATVATPSDRLLVFYGEPAFYLFWPYRTAMNTVWLTGTEGLNVTDPTGPLPPATLAYYRRERTLPDVVLRVVGTQRLSQSELAQLCGGLHYDLVLRRPQYVIFRRPAAVTTLAQALRPTR